MHENASTGNRRPGLVRTFLASPVEYVSPLPLETCAARLQAARTGGPQADAGSHSAERAQYRWQTRTQVGRIVVRGTLSRAIDGETCVTAAAGRYWHWLGRLRLTLDIVNAVLTLGIMLRGVRLGIFGAVVIVIPILNILSEAALTGPKWQALANLRELLEIPDAGTAGRPVPAIGEAPPAYRATTGETAAEMLNSLIEILIFLLVIMTLSAPLRR